MSVVKAVFKRNLASFFGNPAGYVFIILFVGMTAWFAFVSESFFANNQATLSSLTFRMPMLLMIFVASVTMSTWAEEKKLGTEELLFTLPTSDLPVVIGKFLANLAIFTAALLFTLSHVLILMHLGDPDLGLIFATYLGYWLMGAAFIATGMFASSLTSNITVGFILGALFCAVFAFAHQVALVFPGRLGEGVNAFAAITHLEPFSRGVVAFEDVGYFLTIIAGMLYLNSVILGRRRWPGGKVAVGADPRLHVVMRIAAVFVIIVSLNVLMARFGGRMDITEESLSSLSNETVSMLDELDSEKPVYIQAFISEEVPPGYVDTRDTLLGLLREYDELAGEALFVKVTRPERYSDEAQEAKDKFDIMPMPVFVQEAGESATGEIFLGAAIICGAEEEMVPFFHPGIPVEYELTRTIRVVSKGNRPKVGVVDNDLKLLGGFDFQTRARNPQWQIVQELKKQYEVDTVRLSAPVPGDVDVVISTLPSLLKEDELDGLIETIKSGKPTLILTDPLPLVNVGLSPRLPRPNPQSNPFMQQQRPQTDPKCDLSRLMNLLGVRVSHDAVVWDKTNPHPQLRHLPPEFVFVIDPGAKKDDVERGFNPENDLTSGLQLMLSFFPGSVSKSLDVEGKLTLEPLIRTQSRTSGTSPWSNCVTQSFFGPQLTPLEALKRMPRHTTPQGYVLAARISGEITLEEEAPAAEGEEPKAAKTASIDVILVADLDVISDQFFEMRKGRWLQFDNVSFILNCVDALSGDESYISLRNRRSKMRTLTKIENIAEDYEQKKLIEENQAEAEAQIELAKAQRDFDEAVQAVEQRSDLDTRTKDIMLASVRSVEERKLTARKTKIEEEKNKKVEAARFAMEQEKRKLRVEKKTMAVILPIIPPLVIALLLYFYRRARENLGAAKSRIMRD